MQSYSVALLKNDSATGNACHWPGGRGSVILTGTIGGATINFQFLGPDGSTWVTIGSAIAAAGQSLFELPPGQIRISISGGTPSALYAQAARIPV